MPRPKKRRRVCCIPEKSVFGPLPEDYKVDDYNNVITLTIEELESLRLMDIEKFDQVQCAERMQVARSTFQRIYSEAKTKVAQCLINGSVLKIEGGNFELCDENLEVNICPNCCRRRHGHGHRGNM